MDQQLFLVPLIGGRYHIITQLAIYKWKSRNEIHKDFQLLVHNMGAIPMVPPLPRSSPRTEP